MKPITTGQQQVWVVPQDPPGLPWRNSSQHCLEAGRVHPCLLLLRTPWPMNAAPLEGCDPHSLAGVITSDNSRGFAYSRAANSVSLCARYETFRSDFTSEIKLGAFLAQVAGIASPPSYLGLTLQNNPLNKCFSLFSFLFPEWKFCLCPGFS